MFMCLHVFMCLFVVENGPRSGWVSVLAQISSVFMDCVHLEISFIILIMKELNAFNLQNCVEVSFVVVSPE